jgi:hypothetical protein
MEHLQEKIVNCDIGQTEQQDSVLMSLFRKQKHVA